MITFPASPTTDIAAAPDAEPAPLAAPLRILVIDDDPLVLLPVRGTLEADGHAVVTVDDPRQAIELFRTAQAAEPFDVVMTDLGMPHLDGRAVARAVKALSPTTPVILLTGWGRGLDADEQAAQDIDHVLAKPPKLRAALAQASEGRSAGEAHGG